MTDPERVQEARRLLQEWLDQQGHERCWYYPDIFRQLCRVLEVTESREPRLPNREEFAAGCRRYQEEEYGG